MEDKRALAGRAFAFDWSVPYGFLFATLFAVGILVSDWLFPSLGVIKHKPTGHGDLGITNGSLLLVFGTPVVFVIGLVVGAVFVGKRPKRIHEE